MLSAGISAVAAVVSVLYLHYYICIIPTCLGMIPVASALSPCCLGIIIADVSASPPSLLPRCFINSQHHLRCSVSIIPHPLHQHYPHCGLGIIPAAIPALPPSAGQLDASSPVCSSCRCRRSQVLPPSSAPSGMTERGTAKAGVSCLWHTLQPTEYLGSEL